jgi:hypothetical protein
VILAGRVQDSGDRVGVEPAGAHFSAQFGGGLLAGHGWRV